MHRPFRILVLALSVLAVTLVNAQDEAPPTDELLMKIPLDNEDTGAVESDKKLDEDNKDEEASDDVPFGVELGSGEGEVKIELRSHSEDKADKGEETNTIIDWSQRQISVVSAAMFEDQSKEAEQLLLQDNKIITIESDALSGMEGLSLINLSTNALSTLDPETFSGLPNLKVLDLSGNPLELPSESLFLNLPALTKIWIAGCNLKEIPVNTFDGMTSLEEINLDGNPIDAEKPLTVAHFAPLTNLSFLSLPESSINPTVVRQLCKEHALLTKVCSQECSVKYECAATDEVPPPDADEEGLLRGGPSILNAEEAAPPLGIAPMGILVMAPPPTDKEPEKKLETMEDPPLPILPIEPAVPEDISDKVQKSVVPIVETIPESSKSGVTGGGVNQTIIGLLIGGMVAVVAGVLLKKNWKKITGKRSEESMRSTPRAAQQDVEQGAEMVPLKNNNDKSPAAQ